MAVKVRCPTCEKVLSAPDAARGKAVKCPGCETKVKVPAGEGSAADSDRAKPAVRKTPVKKRVEADSTEFLAGLDLDKVIDSSHQMCPKCGANIPDEATECPKCGVDPTTGQLSAAARKRKSRKGPDPAEFYGAAWKDSWAFAKSNFSVVLRTFLYFFVLEVMQSGAASMTQWCTSGPPKFFWFAMTLVLILVTPGWQWHVIVETVRVTAARKSSIRGLHFDLFTNIALGVKAVLWCIVFCWFPPAIVMMPLALIHMSMPVTTRGWVNVMMVPTFFRNFLPTMYFWVIAFITHVPVAIVLGIPILIFRGTLEEIRKAGAIPTGMPAAKVWTAIGVTLVCGIIWLFVKSFLLLFIARVIGLLAYYFQEQLDLVTFVAEKTYARKEVKVDAWGNPIKTKGEKVMGALFVVGILAVLTGAGFFMYYQLFKKNG